MDQTAILADLTEAQRAAVTHVDGPLLIIAAAGSGKTRVITRRVAYLVGKEVAPWSILAITFTNKAAGEMKNRVAAALGRPLYDFGRLDTRWPTICTFHSLCLRILRYYATRVGMDPHFSIYDSSDQEKVVKEAIKLLEISAGNFTPGAMRSAISNAKNKLQTPAMFAAAVKDFFARTAARVYEKYQKLLAERNALDFDDLLMRAVLAFKQHPDVLEELQERFRYILIDEYQDTNHAQYMLAHALAMRHRNICVVGDPDQSIYAWRGADIRNILEFERDYRDANVVKLEQNYRSTQTILKVADTLIKHNHKRKDKRLFSENDPGEPATVLICQDERDEAETIARMLAELNTKQKIDWSRMAIFYRINALSRVLEDALRRKGIPYIMVRGVAFYDRRVVRDVLAYLRLIANPADQVNLERIVNTPPRGISDATMKRIEAAATVKGISTWEAMNDLAGVGGITERAKKAVESFVAMAQRWRKVVQEKEGPGDTGRRGETVRIAAAGDPRPQPPNPEPRTLSTEPRTPNPDPSTPPYIRDLMEDVVKRSGMEAALKKEAAKLESSDEEESMANVNELISSAAEFEDQNPGRTLEDYLAHVALVSDVDGLKEGSGAVAMMTLHAAKGLEFPVVVMAGLEEGLLPHARAREDRDQLEEERRLCFVGITRAQSRLIMSRATTRTIRGISERTIPSPFLREMPEDSLEVIDPNEMDRSGRGHGRARRTIERDEAAAGRSRFRKGQRVRHPKFGVGVIVDLAEMGEDMKVVVIFREGKKTLVVPPAKLDPA